MDGDKVTNYNRSARYFTVIAVSDLVALKNYLSKR